MNYLRRQQIRFQEWKERQRKKCKVRIENPVMWVKGKVCQNSSDHNETYIAFFGIPYAEPPVESLRFQPPQPYRVPRLNYVYRAYNPEHPSLQYKDNGEVYGSEDCLYLNIYLPRKPKHIRTPLPVLVFIHGGGFDRRSGDISHVKPDYIIKQNLIFVTINYRLGIFGFLNMGTPNCKGNAGLKDQVLALKWIKNNIKRFGGDPKNITISGHSAGATCVNLHMISPLSRGLFHKAIVQAGGMYCPWGFLGNEQRVRQIYKRALRDFTIESAVETLRNGNYRDLLYVTQKINNDLILMETKKPVVFMGPTLEEDERGAFLHHSIEYLRGQATPVPLMAGICKGEGYMYLLDRMRYYPNGFRSLILDDQKFIKFLQQNFCWSERIAIIHQDDIRHMYFPDLLEMSAEDIAKNLADLNTDIWFWRFYDNFKIGDFQAPYYVYQFSFIADNDRVKTLDEEEPTVSITRTAPSHGDEFCYQYEQEHFHMLDGGQISQEKLRIINTMCTLLAQFCRMGNFNEPIIHGDVEWYPHKLHDPRYLNIDRRLTMINFPLRGNRWSELSEIVNFEPRTTTPLPYTTLIVD